MSLFRIASARLSFFILGISLSRLAWADLPLHKLPPGIQLLTALPEETLTQLFREGVAPTDIPLGRALGYHRLSRETLNRAPWTHMLAVKTIWQAKNLDSCWDVRSMQDSSGAGSSLSSNHSSPGTFNLAE